MSGQCAAVLSTAPLNTTRKPLSAKSSFSLPFAISASFRYLMHLAWLPISGVSIPETNGTPCPSSRISCPSQRTVSPSTAVRLAHTITAAIICGSLVPLRGSCKDNAPSTTNGPRYPCFRRSLSDRSPKAIRQRSFHTIRNGFTPTGCNALLQTSLRTPYAFLSRLGSPRLHKTTVGQPSEAHDLYEGD